MLADQRPRSIAERHARMHCVSRKQPASQRPLAARAEQPCELLEIDRHALLVAIRARRTDRENPQCLRSTIESRNQVPVDFMRRETLRLVGTEKPVCDEDGAFSDGCVRDQLGIDPHGDVQSDMFGVGEHEVSKIDAVARCSRDGFWLLIHGHVGQNLMCGIEDGVLGFWKDALATGTKKPRGHRAHLLAAA